MSQLRKLCTRVCLALMASSFFVHAQAQSSQESAFDGPAVQDNMERLFTTRGWDTGAAFGGAAGFKMFGGWLHHDLAMGNIHLGKVISDVKGAGHWYEGNFEVLGEAFGGYQLNEGGAYVLGFTPFIRYNFKTHCRWVPFVEAGAGISYTDIGGPDLSTKFEFNLQPGVGLHYIICPDLAFSLYGRFFHLSNAGIENPNHGVNAAQFLLGLSWFL